jgi:hypothetical protein
MSKYAILALRPLRILWKEGSDDLCILNTDTGLLITTIDNYFVINLQNE